MKSLRKKLFLSILAVAFAVVSLATSTFAWFSMNKTVTVTGMVVKTQVNSNLLIAGDTLASDAIKADSNFGTELVQSVKGILEPASTIDAESFFYTKNAKADGDAVTDSYTEYDPSAAATNTTLYDSAFSEYYGVTKTGANALIGGETGAKPFVDYVFQLKAINSGSAAVINLTKLELLYNGAVSTSNAYRVAVFVEDITAGTATANVGTLKGIYKESAAGNFTSTKAVDSESSLDDVTYVSSKAAIANVAAESTKYFKVVVRLWLEGEDTTCNNATFLPLTSEWKLDLQFDLEDDTTNAVTAIEEKGLLTTAAVVTAEGKQTISAVDYNVVTGVTYEGKQVYTKTAAGTIAANSELFTIEAGVATDVTSSFKIVTA